MTNYSIYMTDLNIIFTIKISWKLREIVNISRFLIIAYFIKLLGYLIDEDLSIAEKNYRTRFHFSCEEIENNMMNINCRQYS